MLLAAALWIVGLAMSAPCMGAAAVAVLRWWRERKDSPSVSGLLKTHFAPVRIEELTITQRKFSLYVRVDLSRALEQFFTQHAQIVRFCGVQKEYAHRTVTFSSLVLDGHDPAVAVPPQFEEIDVGGDEPVPCLSNGLWLLQVNGFRWAVYLTPESEHSGETGIVVQVAVPQGDEGQRLVRQFFKHLEQAVMQATSYRGKVLSLEQSHPFFGKAADVRVHRLRTVQRDQVILPRSTIDLLDRNVLRFVEQRPRLTTLGLSTKKGLLFYGPPGTGKTHTIHYLAGALPGHTTLLITAEQMGLLSEYMALARLLQPTLVVIEDVDLIGRERTSANMCSETVLNKLLNEMDGLRADADILFVLTTNHPQLLEQALAGRPGRIDQAIEFPLPDEEGREKLIRLYARGASLADGLIEEIVRRTDRVSAAFIKELMRRSSQFFLERQGASALERGDVEQALDEMLFAGGSLNAALLGADLKGGSNAVASMSGNHD